LLTVVTSIPLLLSFNIKYVGFPQGLPYVFLYFAGLLSVFVTPAHVLLGLRYDDSDLAFVGRIQRDLSLWL
jgi:hypothetical protein